MSLGPISQGLKRNDLCLISSQHRHGRPHLRRCLMQWRSSISSLLPTMRIWLFLVKESGFVMVCPEMRDKTWEKTMANVVLNHRVWVYPFFDKPLWQTYIYIMFFPQALLGENIEKECAWGLLLLLFLLVTVSLWPSLTLEFNGALHTWDGRGDPTMVQDKLLSEMRSVALSPDVITYTSLVQNCASQILGCGSWVSNTSLWACGDLTRLTGSENFFQSYSIIMRSTS